MREKNYEPTGELNPSLPYGYTIVNSNQRRFTIDDSTILTDQRKRVLKRIAEETAIEMIKYAKKIDEIKRV